MPEGLVIEAAKYAGLQYVWGGTDLASGVDCSGYVLGVFERRGLPFPSRLTAEGMRQFCTPVGWDDIGPGDLLFVDHPEDRVEAPSADGHAATHVAISLGVGSGRVWSAQEPSVRQVVVAGNDWWQNGLIGAGRYPDAPVTPLPTTPEAAFGYDVFYPVLKIYADLYGADAAVMMAMARQESPDYSDPRGVVNRSQHDDGHGCGIFGLDDRYLLRDFERWCRSTFVDAQFRSSIAPVLQLEFVAKWLSENTPRYGSAMVAARVWHTGAGGYLGPNGDNYEALLRGHIQALGLG